MEFSVTKKPLSALSPVKFSYTHNSEETLTGELTLYKGNFSYYEHEILNNFKDAALSKQNCVVLTELKSLSRVFKSNSQLKVGQIGGSLYVGTKNGLFWANNGDGGITVGKTKNKLLITITPIANNIAQINVGNRETYLEVAKEYPYDIRISDKEISIRDAYTREFEIEYENGLMSFKTKTADGWRFLSHGTDNIIRAVGLEMSEIEINSYKFVCEFITTDEISYGFDPSAKEVKYFNDLSSNATQQTLDINTITQNDTHLLLTCPTVDMSRPNLSSVNVNIAMTKTNFSSTGTFNSLI